LTRLAHPSGPADSAPTIQTDDGRKKPGGFRAGRFAARPRGGYGWGVVDVSTASIEVAAGRHSRWVVVSRWEPLPRLCRQPGPRSSGRGPVSLRARQKNPGPSPKTDAGICRFTALGHTSPCGRDNREAERADARPALGLRRKGAPRPALFHD